MNLWELGAVILLGALLPCVAICLRAGAGSALAALEITGTVVTTVLMILSEAFVRQPFIDLAIVAALLTSVGSLAFARLMEQDL